jgi:hypothetical protein
MAMQMGLRCDQSNVVACTAGWVAIYMADALAQLSREGMLLVGNAAKLALTVCLVITKVWLKLGICISSARRIHQVDADSQTEGSR